MIMVVSRDMPPASDDLSFRAYLVPTAAHQCMPETAPASTAAHRILLHQAVFHVDSKTKKTASAVVLAATAIRAAPTT